MKGSPIQKVNFNVSLLSLPCQTSLIKPPLHYRLRCTIGVLNVQKKSKSKLLFLTEGIPKYKNFALFVESMTQILYQKKIITFQKASMAKIMVNVQKRLKGASVKVAI